MICREKRRRARTPGAVVAGLALAALLAGCGGGGGGGGGGSSPTPTPTPTPVQPEVVVAGPASVTAPGTVGSVTASPPTPELDLLSGAATGSVTVTLSTDPNAPALPTGYSVASPVYDFQPSATQFGGSGITIKIPYNSAAANPTYLQIYYYDAPSGTWQPVQSGGRNSSITDTTNHAVGAQTTQIVAGRTNGSGPADYVVLGPPTPPTTPSVRAQ